MTMPDSRLIKSDQAAYYSSSLIFEKETTVGIYNVIMV